MVCRAPACSSSTTFGCNKPSLSLSDSLSPGRMGKRESPDPLRAPRYASVLSPVGVRDKVGRRSFRAWLMDPITLAFSRSCSLSGSLARRLGEGGDARFPALRWHATPLFVSGDVGVKLECAADSCAAPALVAGNRWSQADDAGPALSSSSSSRPKASGACQNPRPIGPLVRMATNAFTCF